MAASASGGRDWYAALPLPWRTDSLGYVLRSIGAAALALGLGLYLQLDSPFSAASTVLLLINPVQGAVVGKGWWRAVGTLVGTLAAFVLTALFAQKMLLFVVALGFWLGLCVGVMSLVRHFYATAAVVAGDTVCLALGPAMVEPEAAFEHIVTRASAVIVGVCCLSLVTVLFSRRTVSGRVRQRLVSLCAATLALVAARHAGAADGELERRRRTLAGEVYAVDDLLGVGRAESRALSAALPAIRGGLAALFSTLMEFRFAGETHWARRLAERGLALPMADDLCLLGGQLERGELDFAGAARRLASLRGRLAAIRRGLPTDQADACREGLFMERLDEQLDDLQAALRGFARLDGRARADVRPAAFHRHYREALRNGARAWLAMLVGGALWFLSGWDQGPTLLAVLGPYCTLLAASPFPAEGTRNFIRGTLYAIPAALLCKFLLLPLINGFPLLLLCLAFFWSFGIQATTVPRRALQGIAYLIAFNTLVATGNLARFDFGDFANQSCAWVLALCISLLVYRLLPKDLERHSASLLDHLRRETLALLRRRAGFDAHAWQARQQHRIAQLGALHGMEHPRSALALRLGFVSLQLGRESRRLARPGRARPGRRGGAVDRVRTASHRRPPSRSAARRAARTPCRRSPGGRRRMAPGRDPHRPRLVAPGLFAKRLVRRGAAWRKDLMKTSFLLALLLSCWSQVQAADDDGKELPPIERYDYGMPLDIERVLSVTPVPATCGVVPLVMLYRDSAGRLHRLQYRGLGAGCSRH